MFSATEQKNQTGQIVSPELAGLLKGYHFKDGVIVALTLVVLILGIALWRLSGSISAIYDIKVMNYGKRGLTISSGEIAIDRIGEFARLFLSDLGNISADSAEGKLKATYAKMTPDAAFRFKSRMEKDVQALNYGDMSMQTLETDIVQFTQPNSIGTPTWDLIVRLRQRFFAAGALVGDRRVDIPVRVQEHKCGDIPCIQIAYIDYPELMTKRGEIVDQLLVP